MQGDIYASKVHPYFSYLGQSEIVLFDQKKSQMQYKLRALYENTT